MPDIVNAGAIVIIGLFTLVAVIGAADQLAPDSGPTSSLARSQEDAAASQDEPSDHLDLEERIPGGDGDDDRRGKHHDGGDERDEDDDKRDGDKDDEDDD